MNFEELMVEIKQRKTQAERLNQRIHEEITLRKTRRTIETWNKKPAGKRSVNGNMEEGSQEGAAWAAQDHDGPDKEQIFRDLLEEAKAAKLQSDNITKLQ